MKYQKRPYWILFVLVVFLYSFCAPLSAQKQNAVWYFGRNAGLDFNTTPPTPLKGELYTGEGCASIADQNGDLLFYTDGWKIWDRSHHQMPHGEGLLGGWSSTQSALIVPLPGSCTKYFVFTTEDYSSSVHGSLHYSIVDMLLNDGYGDIIEASKNTFVVDSVGERLTAVLHANGEDIWILTHRFFSNDFLAYLLTSAGLNPIPVISSVGSIHPFNGSAYTGPIRSANDGSQLICAVTFEQICELFDFNNVTGQISNPINLEPLIGNQQIYGIEFSLNDSLIYLASGKYSGSGADTNNFVWQMNLNEDPPEITTLNTYPIFGGPWIGQLQLGIDGKIYVSTVGQPTLDVIQYPDRTGLACEYTIAGQILFDGTTTINGLPNPAPYSFCPTPSLGHDQVLCQGDTVRLELPLHPTLNCPQNLSWYDGTKDSIKIFTKPGMIWINVDDGCNQYSDTLVIDSVYRSILDTTICHGQIFEGHAESGIYSDTLVSINGCDSIYTLEITVNPYDINPLQTQNICRGESYEGYTESGIYIDTLTDALGCDYIRTIELHIINCDPVIQYSLDSCVSVMANGSHLDYSEFTPAYPNILGCTQVSASPVSRIAPSAFKHSCTPGVDSSIAMCVGASPLCSFVEGNPSCIVIDFTITPTGDSTIIFKGLEFYEKGPENFSWINGPSGPNNYPLYYGIRILRNGEKIYRKGKTITSRTWALQEFNFTGEPGFKVDTTTQFRIELWPYCPFDNGAVESVWDIDEIKIFALCAAPLEASSSIEGFVVNKNGQGIAHVEMELSESPGFEVKQTSTTNATGHYVFQHIPNGKSYYIRGVKNDNLLNGVDIIDLLQIQKHLLGVKTFSSMMDYMAADINHNQQVAAFDLLVLKKALLGKSNEFPQNSSWRICDLYQDFSIPDLQGIRETIHIESLDNDITNINFIGVKIGDLTGDAIPR